MSHTHKHGPYNLSPDNYYRQGNQHGGDRQNDHEAEARHLTQNHFPRYYGPRSPQKWLIQVEKHHPILMQDDQCG